MDTTQLPPEAFQFRANPAAISKPAAGGSKLRQIEGTPYTGKPLRHPWFGQVVIDMSSTAANDSTPVLLNHNPDKRVGKTGLSFDGGQLTMVDGELLNNDHAAEVAADSDDGFPWQMSMHVQPGSVEEIRAGTTAEVNGNTVHGPAVIWRNNFIREVSFTPTGVDYGTSAKALSAAFGGSNPPYHTKEEHHMDLEKLQAENARLSAELETEKTRADVAEAALATEKTRADEAEQQLSAAQTEHRTAAIKELFSATGQEYTDEAAKPFIDMDDAAFSAVSAQMKGLAKKQQGQGLFGDVANNGRQAPPDGQQPPGQFSAPDDGFDVFSQISGQHQS